MQLVLGDVNKEFVSFLKGEIASKGIVNTSLRELFLSYIRTYFSGEKYVNSLTPFDRQTLLVESIEDSLILTFKYIIENNEYLEVEAVISDQSVQIIFSESPDLHLLYDCDKAIKLNVLQTIKNENDYGMTLADVFSILFKSLFTNELNHTVKNQFYLTNMFDRMHGINVQQDDITNDYPTRKDLANIWVF